MTLIESNSSVPHLCGGVFLSLLDASKKSTTVMRKQLGHKGSGITFTEILADLVKIADPSRKLPDRNDLKSFASDYRRCIRSDSGHFPFSDLNYMAAFTERITKNYKSALLDVRSFALKYFDTDNEAACKKLVSRLIETISLDTTIAETEQFFCADCHQEFKAAFCNHAKYDLAEFLLAIWYYIVKNRSDNTIGKETFLAWHTQSSTHSTWKYIGTIGDNVTRQFSVYVSESADSTVSNGLGEDHADSSTSENAELNMQDIDRVNKLWMSIQGTRLEPIEKNDEIAPSEMAYVYPLFAAYGEYLKKTVTCRDDLTPSFQTDLEVRRQHFYDAETVRLQGEQALGNVIRKEFDDLKRDILASVWNTYMDDYLDGFKRMIKVMLEASRANCTKGNLVKTGWIGSGEKQGIGHMLAAEKKLVWAVNSNE